MFSYPIMGNLVCCCLILFHFLRAASKRHLEYRNIAGDKFMVNVICRNIVEVENYEH